MPGTEAKVAENGGCEQPACERQSSCIMFGPYFLPGVGECRCGAWLFFITLLPIWILSQSKRFIHIRLPAKRQPLPCSPLNLHATCDMLLQQCIDVVPFCERATSQA